jgi:hypothetical protein
VKVIAILAALAAAACSRSPEPTWKTALDCPNPGGLPFHTLSHGFQSAANASLAATDTRIKDQSSDNLGNPGGLIANVDIPNDADPTAGPIDYNGSKSRTTNTEGANESPLAGEVVSLWFYDYGTDGWQQVARGRTDDNGDYDFPSTNFIAPNGAPIYSLLEADNVCTWHMDWLLPPNTPVVVFDIDGTLTNSDSEFTMQIIDGTYTPVEMSNGVALTQAWANKGYQVIYLTARAHVFDYETRMWLSDLGFAPGPVITTIPGGFGEDVLKTFWLDRFVNDFNWNIVAAYGNQTTDITAYGNVDVPLDRTFIVGPVGGTGGTVAILDKDYGENIVDFVGGMPTLCTFPPCLPL